MKWRFTYLVILLLLALPAFAQSAVKPTKTEQPKPTKTEQRFTMLSAEVMVLNEDGVALHRESHVLLLDSWTGRVWLYSPASLSVTSPDKKAISIPARFDRVYVDGVDDKSAQPAIKTFDTVAK